MKPTLIAITGVVLLSLVGGTAGAQAIEASIGYVCRLTAIPRGGIDDLGSFGHLHFRLTAKPNCVGVIYEDLRICSTGATDADFCMLEHTFTEVGLQTMAQWLADAVVQQFRVRIEKTVNSRGVANVEIVGDGS